MKGKLVKFVIPGVVVVGLMLFVTTYKFGMLEAMIGDMEAPAEEVAVVAPAAPAYVEIDTLSIPILVNGEMVNRVDLTLQLDVAEADVALVKTQLPRIRDAYMTDLHEYLPKHMNGRKHPDLFVLKDHLVFISKKLAGGKINDVVIKGAFNR